MRTIDKRLRQLEKARAAAARPRTIEEVSRRLAVLLAKAINAEPADIEKALPELARSGTLQRIAVEAQSALEQRQISD